MFIFKGSGLYNTAGLFMS